MNKTNSIFGITEPAEYGINQEAMLKWRGFESKRDLHPSVLNYWMPMCKDVAFSCFNSTIPISTGEKAHIILHCDHSSYQSLGTAVKNTGGLLNRAEVDLFENYPFNKILISYGCSLGDFRKDCIIEHLLNNPNGGVVSVIASSTTSYDEYDRIQPLLQKLYQWKSTNGVIHQPVLYNIALLHYNTQGTGMLNTRKNHLFGDPELPVWTREPVDLTVSTSPSTITNQNGQLTVSVGGMVYSEYATNDVFVCVMKDGEVYKREHYDGTSHNHNFVFDVNPETAGELKVTVTGHNYIPYETTVPVTITGKNVYISEKSVLDATGNDDGNLDAGETDNLSITLKNNGAVNLTNVTATLSCEFLDENLNQNINDYLNIVTSTANYGTIAQNTTVTRNDFQLVLSNAIPDRTSMRCTLTIRDGNGVVNERSFTLPIGAPEIEYVSVRHDPPQTGRVRLNIDLVNLGFGTAKGVTATLASSDVQITEGTALYGTMTHLEAKMESSFEFISNGGIDGKSFTLTVTDAYNKSWSYSFILYDIIDTIENLTFTNTEHSIKLKWDPVEDSKGYYVYRSMTANGNYERLNSYPVPSSVYPDLGLEIKQTYYYEVSYLDEYGNESEKARITAWTSLPIAEGWPVAIPDSLGRAWGTAPNLADINGDGKQEIFLTTGTADNPGNMGTVLGFNSLGEELYDIDHNPTTVSGFANLGISMNCTPAIGDIDNDGIMEIVVATRDDTDTKNHKLFVFKNRDADNDGAPDLAWEISIDTANFNGVVLADLDDNGTLEIIAPNQGRNGSDQNHSDTITYLEVFDCLGNYYYPKDKIKVKDLCNRDEKAVTMPGVADFDNDGHKEIVFGLEGGVYMWGYSNQEPTLLVASNVGSNNPNEHKERMDCPVIAADIDDDDDLEILYMVIRNGIGYIRAINLNQSSVSGWNGDTHFITLKGDDPDWEWPPYFCVADIDNDGSIEIFAADNDTLKMWDSDGTTFGIGEMRIPNLDCRYFQPVIADVDGNGDCEIVIPSQNGYIYAYKPNGNAVPGWPLAVVDLATIPAITDIDGDGYNEVVAASQTELYVWNTEGESKYNHCDRFRYNKHNNAVYEIPCSYNEVPLEITGTHIWTDDRSINRDIIVNNGARLTIKSELRFSEDSKIIVKPGGRLILDGCRLTNACSDALWPGIEVWGNSNTHQYAIHGSYGQGYIELKNGATIENAKCAVELWRPGYWNTTGGIIHASDATFRNNTVAVHALCYRNFTPGSNVEAAYNGDFNNCSFVINGGYIGTETFKKHVILSDVNGIGFHGCDFSADRSIRGVHTWCIGISAYDAGFLVNSSCSSSIRPCPEEDMDRSTFTGFCSGISVDGSGNLPRSFTVSEAVFTNNDFGIYATNTNFPIILNSEFNIGRGEYCDYNYGICLKNVTGFTIEENYFHPSSQSNATTVGIAIYNSNGINDVYHNTFENLSRANLALGQNVAGTNGMIVHGASQGLTYTCNDNTGNQRDFMVLVRDGAGAIQQHQGSPAMPTGNTFRNSGFQFYNEGTPQIEYYYNSNERDEIPDTSLLYRVNPHGTTNSNPCYPHYGNGPVRKSASEKAALGSDYLSAYNAFLNLKQLYENSIDGGSTATQVAGINNATPVDMWQLRAQLLGLSPYVSGKVLTTAADRDDVFTVPVLFEILAANPDELKNDSLIVYLESKTNPLPDYMVGLLRQIASGVTSRTALVAQMGKYSHDYALAAGDIVRSNLNDTIANPSELRNWLGNMNDIAADRMAISSYLQEGDSASAFALANMLPELYGLQGDALSDHGDYLRLLGLYQTLKSSHRNVYELTEAEIAAVRGIAETGTGVSRSMAESLMGEITGEDRGGCFEPDTPDPKEGEMGRGKNMEISLKEALGFSVNVMPNPATTWVTVNYTLPVKVAKATLTMTNIVGMNVLSAELEGTQGNKVLDLRSLAAGVYMYTIRCGEYVQVGKLVITK